MMPLDNEQLSALASRVWQTMVQTGPYKTAAERRRMVQIVVTFDAITTRLDVGSLPKVFAQVEKMISDTLLLPEFFENDPAQTPL